MADKNMIQVEVAYAKPDVQVIIHLEVEENITLEEAIQRSGIVEQFPEIEPVKSNKVGIFGKIAMLDTPLRDHDRVEIYRPLIADPKESRRKRAEKKEKKSEKASPDAARSKAD